MAAVRRGRRARYRARRLDRRSAQPRHAQWPRHAGRSGHDRTDARLQFLAVRRVDRWQEADHPGRHEFLVAALEPHIRVRTDGFPAAGQDYNHDLLAVATGLHGGPLPATMKLAGLEPARVTLSALKPR